MVSGWPYIWRDHASAACSQTFNFQDAPRNQTIIFGVSIEAADGDAPREHAVADMNLHSRIGKPSEVSAVYRANHPHDTRSFQFGELQLFIKCCEIGVWVTTYTVVLWEGVDEVHIARWPERPVARHGAAPPAPAAQPFTGPPPLAGNAQSQSSQVTSNAWCLSTSTSIAQPLVVQSCWCAVTIRSSDRTSQE